MSLVTNYTGYWIFFCNPSRWEIDRFLKTNIEHDTYQVTDWQKEEFKAGQLGIIRVGVDKRTKKQLDGRSKLNAGIYAVVEILSESHLRKKKPEKFWRNWNKVEFKRPVVDLRYIKNLIKTPLLLSELKHDAIIQMDKHLINGFQASSIPLEKKVFNRIIELLEDGEQIFENVEPVKVDNESEIISLEKKYRNASPQVKEVISKRIERGNISNKIRKLYGYKCKLCEQLGISPLSFKKINGEHYIETHHIIEVSKLVQGSLGLSNIITVCANHHRQFHYGDIKIIKNTKDDLVISIDGRIIEIKKMEINKRYQGKI